MAVDVIPAPSGELEKIRGFEKAIALLEKERARYQEVYDAAFLAGHERGELANIYLGWMEHFTNIIADLKKLQSKLPPVCPMCKGSQTQGSGQGVGTCMYCGGGGLARDAEKRRIEIFSEIARTPNKAP